MHLMDRNLSKRMSVF